VYSLKEFWQLRNLPLPEGEWDGNVICLETNAEWTFGANETHGFLSCYIYTIVTRGWVTILYNNRELTLHEGDLYTYSPGFEVTDLSAIQQHSIREHRFPKRVEEIFLGFLGLLPQHFEEHHDIGFYASELCITTTYLSRVVRQVSGGRTVVDYINQMLLMEAVFLLRQTSLSITQISDQLHFAEVTTFARFFNRMKGMNPREFRKGK
jgi:AraC-like DNA-binding protein